MEAIRIPRIKICCIGSREEARLAIQYGASALGLVSEMPSGPGVIEEHIIADIASSVPPGVTSVLLTSKQDVNTIIQQQRSCRVNAVQIVDSLPPGSHQKLQEALPGITLIQVIHVMGQQSLEEAQAIAPYVHALLLDSGNPTLAIKELGGTGRIHDWEISRAIREAVDIPIFLAGGLRAENIQQAIQAVGPYGLDLCSGVRTNGKLDEQKLARFFVNVQNSWQ